MKKTYAFILLCIGIALLGTACSTAGSVDLPKGSSKGYSSFRFYRDAPSNPNFLDREDVVNDIIKDALTQELGASGLKRSSEGAELVVAYLIVTQDLAVSTAMSDYYINSPSEILSIAHKRFQKKNNLPYNYEHGALVIDIIDTNTGDLIYRNYAKREVEADFNENERNEMVRSAVTEAMAAFLKQK